MVEETFILQSRVLKQNIGEIKINLTLNYNKLSEIDLIFLELRHLYLVFFYNKIEKRVACLGTTIGVIVNTQFFFSYRGLLIFKI